MNLNSQILCNKIIRKEIPQSCYTGNHVSTRKPVWYTWISLFLQVSSNDRNSEQKFSDNLTVKFRVDTHDAQWRFAAGCLGPAFRGKSETRSSAALDSN